MSTLFDMHAPLCLDDPALEKAIWYPGEAICKRAGISFAAIQRRIVRAGMGADSCFTISMLRRNIPITKTLRGLDPERPRAEALESWLKQHKGRAPLSEEEKERRREIIRGIKCPDSSRNGNRQGLPGVYPVSDVELFTPTFRDSSTKLSEGAETGCPINNAKLGTDIET
jgi:hypothetical protein